jgi:two-component system sensor histidine kinase BaeS
MPDGPWPSRGNTLGVRLTLGFLGVALVAIALITVLTAVFSAVDVSSLGDRQRDELASAFAVAAGSSYQADDGWTMASLKPVLDLARGGGVQLMVRAVDGRVIAATGPFSAAQGALTSLPVVVQGTRVGTVTVGLTPAGLGAADSVLQSALWRAIAGTAGLAALLALIAGLGAARRITRPVGQLIAVARAMAGGDRSARAGQLKGAGELRELAAAFDNMADTLDREDRIRRDLVASVAHELRTPVAVLQAAHEALLDGVTEPTGEELGSLRDEVLRLARMVDDLQVMAAADAAVLRLAREPQDLAAIAGAAADSLAHRFEAAEVTLRRELAPLPVQADERWMHQVVTNLLSNALKFTPAGGTVAIRGRRDGGDAVLEVEDTGIGIPPADLPRVFDRFWRGESARPTSGSGIGLAIVAELTSAHGGTITAASPPGGGARFTLTLPADASPDGWRLAAGGAGRRGRRPRAAIPRRP